MIQNFHLTKKESWTTLYNELEKLNSIIKELSKISDEANGNLNKSILESWRLKSFSKFSSKASEQLSITTNREKFINEKIKRAKIYGLIVI